MKPKEKRDRFPDDQVGEVSLSMSQERQLGRVVTAWSDLESVMEVLIWELFSVDMEHGKIITKRLNTDGRLQTLRALIKLHFVGAELSAISKTIDVINELKEERNFVAHGSWFRDKQGYAVVASTRPKTDPFTVVVERFSWNRLNALYTAIKVSASLLGAKSDGLRSRAAQQASRV